MAPRSLLLRQADRLLDHPGPSTVALQRCVTLVLLDVALTGFRIARRLTR